MGIEYPPSHVPGRSNTFLPAGYGKPDNTDASGSADSPALPGQHPNPPDAPLLSGTDYIEDNAFDYSGYQVVRGEFFAHLREPSISFSNNKISFNAACVRRMPTVNYIQILVSRETKKLVILPCSEHDKDSFLWCNVKDGKRMPKQITCRIFFLKLTDLLSWNPDYRYKLLGKFVRSRGQFLILFDLLSAEVYVRETTENGKPKSSRSPIFPAEWKDQFGLPLEAHRKQLQLNIFDGYTVFQVKTLPRAGTTTGGAE